MESSKENYPAEIEVASQEMLTVLKRYVDIPISLDDFEELRPETDWYNKVDDAWASLRALPEYTDRLKIIERYREPAYVLLSNPDDTTILYKRSYRDVEENLKNAPKNKEIDYKKYSIAIALGAGALAGILVGVNKIVRGK